MIKKHIINIYVFYDKKLIQYSEYYLHKKTILKKIRFYFSLYFFENMLVII